MSLRLIQFSADSVGTLRAASLRVRPVQLSLSGTAVSLGKALSGNVATSTGVTGWRDTACCAGLAQKCGKPLWRRKFSVLSVLRNRRLPTV